MSSIRLKQVFKEFFVRRLVYNWTRRKGFVSSVVRKCREDRGFCGVIQCFRYAFFRPTRTLFLSVTAAYHNNDEEESSPRPCNTSISDEELKALVTDFDNLEELSHRTLFCTSCQKRVQFDKKQQGICYCSCKEAKPIAESHNGWVPFMEAEDVVIWRKEHKGNGMYAYKVYGHYTDVKAEDFAAVQVDGAYRKAWDDAVAALSVVERSANGVPDQSVLHWEVLWPRLFANRDYVYMRRHKEFDVKSGCKIYARPISRHQSDDQPIIERENVHTKAKLKSLAMEKKAGIPRSVVDNKLYVIVSRACEDPRVPETNNAVRVREYWSHMVIRTVNGPHQLGTEFVLTYYDEPAVGGMPTAIASFAAARGAPAFLARMRCAARQYSQWRRTHRHEEQDFTPFGPERLTQCEEKSSQPFSEQGMESSKRGIDLEVEATSKYDKQTQTDITLDRRNHGDEEIIRENVSQIDKSKRVLTESRSTNNSNTAHSQTAEQKSTTEVTRQVTGTPEVSRQLTETPEAREKDGERDNDKAEEEDEKKGFWYKYFYPFYYFI